MLIYNPTSHKEKLRKQINRAGLSKQICRFLLKICYLCVAILESRLEGLLRCGTLVLVGSFDLQKQHYKSNLNERQ